jgi:hypothetical protein
MEIIDVANVNLHTTICLLSIEPFGWGENANQGSKTDSK